MSALQESQNVNKTVRTFLEVIIVTVTMATCLIMIGERVQKVRKSNTFTYKVK